MKRGLMDKIAIIGLGYVGLPLAVEFAKKYEVIGFDINENRISELQKGIDRTLEVENDELKSLTNLKYSTKLDDIKEANIYIVTVPTPIDEYKKPDLRPLLGASKSIGSILKKDDIVIYESTVYPGCTEDDCVPILENQSNLKFNKDFFVGYSPERINPGDKEHRLPTIKKVTSGSTPQIAIKVDELYKSIITAGTHLAPSIRVAEAAKVIENAQRDINIAFVNELALIFEKMGIDTNDVLDAASTKWNFLPFKPGLVGGHCIGVDPYYLTHKADSLGYRPEVILSGRRINDNMGIFIANSIIKLMIKKGIQIDNSNVLVLGITFKENCPVIRNSKVIDIIRELKEFNIEVDVYDSSTDKQEVKDEYGVDLINNLNKKYDGVVLAVSHNEFKKLNLKELKKDKCVVYDVKSFLSKDEIDLRL